MKPHQRNNIVLNAADKFSRSRNVSALPEDLSQLQRLAIQLLNEKDLKVSQVKPFFWSMVETYVDRFQIYPFDVNKALFSYLELNEFPEELVLTLVKQLEAEFEKAHGRPLRKSTQLRCQQDVLDDAIKELRDSLKYAAMVAECED